MRPVGERPNCRADVVENFKGSDHARRRNFAAMFQADMRRILSERTGVELSEDEYRVAFKRRWVRRKTERPPLWERAKTRALDSELRGGTSASVRRSRLGATPVRNRDDLGGAWQQRPSAPAPLGHSAHRSRRANASSVRPIQIRNVAYWPKPDDAERGC